jgi:hypothetical protein
MASLALTEDVDVGSGDVLSNDSDDGNVVLHRDVEPIPLFDVPCWLKRWRRCGVQWCAYAALMLMRNRYGGGGGGGGGARRPGACVAAGGVVRRAYGDTVVWSYGTACSVAVTSPNMHCHPKSRGIESNL